MATGSGPRAEEAAASASACDSHQGCARAGLRGPGMECCPARDGTFLRCCPLRCFFDGVRCMPAGRVDVLADLACAQRLRPDGKPPWDLSEGAGQALCQDTGAAP